METITTRSWKCPQSVQALCCIDFVSELSHCRSVPHKDPRNCWMCGKPVSPDDAGIDEFDAPVHKECKFPGKKQTPPPPKPPKQS